MAMKMIDLLPRKEEDAISRSALAALLGVSDRVARKQIEEAGRGGYVIRAAKGGGYWLDESEEGWKALQRELTARALSLLKTANRLKNHAYGMEGKV